MNSFFAQVSWETVMAAYFVIIIWDSIFKCVFNIFEEVSYIVWAIESPFGEKIVFLDEKNCFFKKYVNQINKFKLQGSDKFQVSVSRRVWKRIKKNGFDVI